MPFRLGPVEIILILVIIFIIFGAGRLPQLFEFVGRGVQALRGGKRKASEDEPAPKKKKKVIKKLED